MSTTEPSQTSVEALDAAPEPVRATVGANELVADTFGEYLVGQWKKIKGGDSGALPVIVGLVLIVVIFQIENSKFLTTGNLVNLIEQSGVFVMLGMAEVFVLLLGEIDLSTGFVAGFGAAITGELVAEPHNFNWFLAVLIGVAVCAAIGLVQGLIITKLGLPSFVVTLAGYLGVSGLLLYFLQHDKQATGGSIALPINHNGNIINDFVNGSMSDTVGWIVMIVLVAVYAALNLLRQARRRSTGLVAPPVTLLLVKIALVAAGGIAIVIISNHNRGFNGTHLSGVPWIAPIILGVLVVYSVLLGRMRFGRYLYAIGGNAEAARRAGISLTRIRVLAFVLCSFTAGMAGMVYLSQQGSIGADIPGGQYVLYAVAAAVIGGTSLFGGRGKMSQAVLGGIVITTIYNGMGLINIGTAGQEMVIALVLLAAVTVDAVARRGRSS
jgi:D-xylose transport system permease protein